MKDEANVNSPTDILVDIPEYLYTIRIDLNGRNYFFHGRGGNIQTDRFDVKEIC